MTVFLIRCRLCKHIPVRFSELGLYPNLALSDEAVWILLILVMFCEHSVDMRIHKTEVIQQLCDRKTTTVSCSKKYSARLWLCRYLVQHCLVHSCRKNGLKKYCYAITVKELQLWFTRGATWLKWFAKKQEKRKETRLYGLLYIAWMWKSTQLHANGDEKNHFWLHRTIVFFRERAKILVCTWVWWVRISVSLKVTLYTLRFANRPLLLWNVAFVTISGPPIHTPPFFFFIQESYSWSFDGEAALGMWTVTCRKWFQGGFSADLADWIYPEIKEKKTKKQWHHTP